MAGHTAEPVHTARGVAMIRALEMMRPAAERLCTDPYAQAFVTPAALHGLRLLRDVGVLRAIGIEAMINFALLRERFIGDMLAEQAADGIGQIVILGAGFDTRAYRLPGLSGIPVFEVDHPVTQAHKVAALQAVMAQPPANVRFVAVDFNRDDLGERLRAAGYDTRSRTLFVWQGVIMYLTPVGIDQTLAVIAKGAPGSRVVFDYMNDTARGNGRNAMLHISTQLMGERLTFTLADADIVPFLDVRGFTDVHTVAGAELARLYAAGPRPVSRDAGIAWATVAAAAASR